MISYEPLFRTMKEKGITSYRLFKMGFPQSNYYAMKHGENVSTNTINELCILLECDVSDIMKNAYRLNTASHNISKKSDLLDR